MRAADSPETTKYSGCLGNHERSKALGVFSLFVRERRMGLAMMEPEIPSLDARQYHGRNGPSPEIKSEILSMGRNFNDDIIRNVIKLYLPLHKRSGQGEVKTTKDLKYGPDDRHKLDIHEPITKVSDGMPTVVFFHGGAFVGGDKNVVGDLVFGNVATYFARNGMLGVNATYRLAPKHQWPQGALDVARVVEWLRRHVAMYSGDPNRIFLFGHSAGAAHVATYVLNEAFQPGSGVGVAGAVLMSGPYHPNANNPRNSDLAYYGPDTENYEERSPINHTGSLKVPLFIIVAELDPLEFEMESAQLLEALRKGDKDKVRFAVVGNHNHLSEVVHLNTGDDSIGPDIIDFIKTCPQSCVS
jgi:acetyl esterase